MEAFVVGGGIAGLAAAAALLRAGWRVTVAERQPVLGEIGAGLALSRNGLRALTWLGLADEVREVGHPVVITGQQDHRGRWLMRQPADDPRYAATNRVVGVHRARLLSVLEQAVRCQAEALIWPGGTVLDVTPGDPGGARAVVTWQGGGGVQRTETDLVVVADGVGSRLRDRLTPGVEVAYSGKTCWRAVIADPATDGAPGLVGDEFVQVWGPHTEFGAVRISPREVYWYGYFVAPAQARFADEHATAVEHFADWSPEIRRIVAATEPERLLRHDVIHLPGGAPSYRSGRAVLVGDAAHAVVPTMGQGANLSLEDGASIGTLIGEPVARGEALAATIATYDRLRRPRGRLIARRSVLTGRFGADLGPGLPQTLRNAAFRLIPTGLVVEAGAGVLDWTPGRA